MGVFFEAHSLAVETDFTWERKRCKARRSLQDLVTATDQPAYTASLNSLSWLVKSPFLCSVARSQPEGSFFCQRIVGYYRILKLCARILSDI